MNYSKIEKITSLQNDSLKQEVVSRIVRLKQLETHQLGTFLYKNTRKYNNEKSR